MPEVPDGIGDGYTYRVVHRGGCTFPGCAREALVFCAEHAHLLSILDQLGQRIARLEQPSTPGSTSSPGAPVCGDAPRPVHGGGVGGDTAPAACPSAQPPMIPDTIAEGLALTDAEIDAALAALAPRKPSDASPDLLVAALVAEIREEDCSDA